MSGEAEGQVSRKAIAKNFAHKRYLCAKYLLHLLRLGGVERLWMGVGVCVGRQWAGGGAVECCGMLCGLHFLPCPNKNPLPGTPTPGSPEQSPRHDDLLYQDVCVTPPQCRTRQAQARSPVSYVDAMCDSPRQARARLPSLSRQSKFFI